MSHPDERRVDPERVKPDNAFDASDGVTGQEYSREREEAERRKEPSGHPLGREGAGKLPATEADGRDIPPDVGTRGFFDPATGEVHGSGAGAGGGNPGEDYDEGTAGGAPEVPQPGAAPDSREPAERRTPGPRER